jgi:hypothetical protein
LLSSDITEHGAARNIDTTDLSRLVGDFPSILSNTNGGLGVTIEYKICPLDYLRFTLGTTNGQASSIPQPSDIFMDSFLHLHEQWQNIERQIKDYDDETKNFRGCYLCTKHFYHDNITDLLEEALQAKLGLQVEFSRILNHRRSSAYGADKLRLFIQDSYKSKLSPKATTELIAQARTRLYLRKLVLSFGSQYADYHHAKNAISVGSNIYVFYFTDETRRDRVVEC